MFKKLQNRGWDVEDLNHGLMISKKLFNSELNLLAEILKNFKLNPEDHFIKRGGGESDQTSHLSKKFQELGWEKNNITSINKIIFERKFNQISKEGTSHEIDHIGFNEDNQKFAIEIEWNNKDEFFDRDFVNFDKLWNLGVIDLGIIITRGRNLDLAIKKSVNKYFKRKNIRDFKGFESLQNSLKDDKGNNKFSFPTDAQKKQIDKYEGYFVDGATNVFCAQKYGKSTTNWTQLMKRIARGSGSKVPLLFFGIPESVIEE